MPKDQRSFELRLEIFRVTRPVSAMLQGGTLRVVDADPFDLVWSADGWVTTHRDASRPVGHAGSFVDVVTGPDQAGGIDFTIFWPGGNRWLGRNYHVTIYPEMPQGEGAGVKPAA